MVVIDANLGTNLHRRGRKGKKKKAKSWGVYKNSEPRQLVAVGVPVVGGRRTTFPRVTAVSSSRRGLTSLFGMVRGAPPRHSRHSALLRPFRMGERQTHRHPHT